MTIGMLPRTQKKGKCNGQGNLTRFANSRGGSEEVRDRDEARELPGSVGCREVLWIPHHARTLPRRARARPLTFALTDSDVCVTMTEGPAPLWTSKGVCLHRTLLTAFLNSVSNSGRT